LRPKTIDAATSTRPSLPTTGSQDTQQNEQDDNMSDNGSFGASDDSELAQWEVLEQMKATTISTHFMVVKTMMRVFK
jgi:hypothetical protein